MEFVRLRDVDFKQCINSRIGVKFLASDVQVKDQKDGGKFILLNMADGQRKIQARKFSVSNYDIEELIEGVVYRASIDVKEYDRSPEGFSCIIYMYERSVESAENYVEWAPGLDKCKSKIEYMLQEYYETTYGKIAYAIIVDHWDKFSRWAAAKGHHHDLLGGLLLHTTEVLEIAEKLAVYFNTKYESNFINEPLLYCACIIHDIGKTYEYDVNTGSGKIEFSAHSTLSTHIMDVISLIDTKAMELGIGDREDEQEEILLLKHCVAAHHGKLEWGSPITPSIPEAYILHMADVISADMFKYHRVLKELDPGEFMTSWENGGYANKYRETSKINMRDEE